MGKHVCCITTSLLGVDVDCNSDGHTYTAQQPCNVDYLTAIQPVLPYLGTEVQQKFCCTSVPIVHLKAGIVTALSRTDHRTYWKHLPTSQLQLYVFRKQYHFHNAHNCFICLLPQFCTFP